MITTIAAICGAIRCAHISTSQWVFVVVPDGSDFYTSYQKVAGGVFPNGSILMGRTAVLPDGSRVTLVPVSESPPRDTPAGFDVLFAGWDDDIISDNRRMQIWRDAANQVLR